MEPTHIRFGGGSSSTILHPLVALALVITIVILLFFPRKSVIGPLIMVAILIPFGQVLVVGGVHFTVYRIMMLFGLIRLVITPLPGGRFAGGFNTIDRAFTFWALSYFICNSLQWMEPQATIKNLGSLLDQVGGYFVLRFLIRDTHDVLRAIKAFIPLAALIALCMIGEQITHRNIFGFLGGIPVGVAMREGHVRSSGPFEVYITAGVFGATLLPLFVLLWSATRSRIKVLLGVGGAAIIAITSNASTSLLACAAGVVAFCCWPIRTKMRLLRIGMVSGLVVLHLAMKAPVWALIARVDLTGSSSGYHRFMLVDGCIRHFSDWWLIGVKDYDTWGWDMWDLCNQYVAYAFTGGLATLIFFILIISRSFGKIGVARRAAAGLKPQEWMLWCLGAALLAHVVGYFGIGYFDQMQFSWYALLAMISAATVVVPPIRQEARTDLETVPDITHNMLEVAQ